MKNHNASYSYISLQTPYLAKFCFSGYGLEYYGPIRLHVFKIITSEEHVRDQVDFFSHVETNKFAIS